MVASFKGIEKISSRGDITVFSGLFNSLLKISLSEAFKGLKAIPHRNPSG